MKKIDNLTALSSIPVSKAVIRNALPAIAAMLMVLIYNLADTFFIGQTHDDFQVAAVSLATPVFLIFMALGTVFGIGGTSVISRSFGEGKTDYCKKVSAFCMWMGLVVGVAVSALFLIFMDDLLRIIGASADTWEMTKRYLCIVTLCGPFVVVANCFSNIIRAEGQAGKAMMGMLIGNMLNVILDPLMILVFGWEITGAAIATVIGNVVGAAYYIIYFVRGKSVLSISIKDYSVRDGVAKNVLIIGVPAALGSLLMSVSQMIMNSMMAGFGDMSVAAAGVSMKVTMMIGMVAIGLGQGVQPLLGYCVGAKNWSRYKSIMKFSVIFALALGVVMIGLCYIFTSQIVGAFLALPSSFNSGVRFARILQSTAFLFGVFYCFINALQSMGAAMSSLIVNLSRQGLIYIPALFVMRTALGMPGLIWAQPIADILSFILAVVLFAFSFRKISNSKTEVTARLTNHFK
ncbi:MAG: MATE family efflux transporter [Oscillospiraceae bacterium]|jgi:putative MATE family efflux protein|nr:MATE family efflux transporter [Oscillospiraceae bacterium]